MYPIYDFIGMYVGTLLLLLYYVRFVNFTYLRDTKGGGAHNPQTVSVSSSVMRYVVGVITINVYTRAVHLNGKRKWNSF